MKKVADEGGGVGVLDPDTGTETRHAPLYKVLIHNDPVTPIDFVLCVLLKVFSLKMEKAIQITLEAHHTDAALVTVETMERAEFHVEQCKSLSSAAKFPLAFSMEPDA